MNKHKTLAEFLADQTPDKLVQINKIRDLIVEVEPRLEENIKWNAPNYVYKGEDRITFNLMNKQNKVKLVIHMGASKKENKKGNPVLANDEKIVDWNSDIRGTITFEDISDIEAKTESLKKVIRSWIALSV